VSDFYVYMHHRKTNGQPFYVGKGKGVRATSPDNRSRYWEHVASKHGWYHSIVASGLTEAQAFALERETICALKGKPGVTLVNHTGGGEGVSGLIHSKKTRHTISEIIKRKYRDDPEYRKKHMVPKSPEARAKMAASHLGKPQSAESNAKRSKWYRSLSPEDRAEWHRKMIANRPRPSFLGKHHTPEFCARQAARMRGTTKSPEQRAKIAESVKRTKRERRATQ
jgi:hypothetical protein